MMRARRNKQSVCLPKLNTMCGEQMGQQADCSAKDDATKGATHAPMCTHTHTHRHIRRILSATVYTSYVFTKLAMLLTQIVTIERLRSTMYISYHNTHTNTLEMRWSSCGYLSTGLTKVSHLWLPAGQNQIPHSLSSARQHSSPL